MDKGGGRRGERKKHFLFPMQEVGAKTPKVQNLCIKKSTQF
jgi:hypothetical protein